MFNLQRKSFRRRIPGFLGAVLLAAAVFLPQFSWAAASEIPYSQGLLWRVQRDGGPASYLLGTIHSTDPRLRELPPEIDRAIDESRLMAFELLAGGPGQERMAQAMLLPPGRNLEDVIGRELFLRALEAAAPLGVPAESLQRFKPWALGIFLGRPAVEVIRQAQGVPAFDFWLQDEARRRGKPVMALESYEEQIEVFDGMSEAEQVAMVTDMLADHAQIEAQFNRMFRAYLKGDIGVAMRIASDVSGVSDAAAAERFKTRLIDDRNRIMAARIAPLLRDGGAFVAVGAAHLPGEDGILARLEQRGYGIVRVY
jgi:uncharacterized protein